MENRASGYDKCKVKNKEVRLVNFKKQDRNRRNFFSLKVNSTGIEKDKKREKKKMKSKKMKIKEKNKKE